MLHKVLSQLAIFSTNVVNNNLAEHSDIGSKLTITLVLKTVKLVTRFFNNIKNHIMEGLVPDFIQNFTPLNVNPKIIQATNAITPVVKIATLKVKSDALPPATPACECTRKK
jgi:hypothetical protein